MWTILVPLLAGSVGVAIALLISKRDSETPRVSPDVYRQRMVWVAVAFVAVTVLVAVSS